MPHTAGDSGVIAWANGVDATLAGVRGTAGSTEITSALKVLGNVGFYGTTPVAKPVITGSRGTESAATTSTRAALVALGLVTDSTTA